ncbi:MAG: hypothetical protein KZQ77_11825 [Candidatus Thiodiazotropha sp. (ex Notomyrtea botanica)]|nr:hypothetical protein [Candidatus Thiodiazotropha sp. (ex Notomyrtea botanica)]
MLEEKAIDFCGISEHWLFEKDLNFLNMIDSNYRSHSVSDSSLRYPNNRRVGKGGVAIMWHKDYDSYVTPLEIYDDRIVGIQIELSELCFIYMFQVYLPCSNHSIQSYKRYLEKMDNILSTYSDMGMIILLGDFNANILSKKFSKPHDYRSRYLMNFVNQNSLVAINTLEMCCGARSSFVSYDGSNESLIDHIMLPIEKLDLVGKVCIFEDNSLNVSSHRPVYCSINVPFGDLHQPSVSSHINWNRVDSESIDLYQSTLQGDASLIHLCKDDYTFSSMF